MEAGGKTMTDKRRIVEVVLLVVVVAAIGGWLWTRRTSPYPYSDGSSHQVTADCSQITGGCSIELGSSEGRGPGWTGETTGATLPPGWRGYPVSGTLHIIHGWGTPSATLSLIHISEPTRPY